MIRYEYWKNDYLYIVARDLILRGISEGYIGTVSRRKKIGMLSFDVRYKFIWVISGELDNRTYIMHIIFFFYFNVCIGLWNDFTHLFILANLLCAFLNTHSKYIKYSEYIFLAFQISLSLLRILEYGISVSVFVCVLCVCKVFPRWKSQCNSMHSLRSYARFICIRMYSWSSRRCDRDQRSPLISPSYSKR